MSYVSVGMLVIIVGAIYASLFATHSKYIARLSVILISYSLVVVAFFGAESDNALGISALTTFCISLLLVIFWFGLEILHTTSREKSRDS